MKAKVRGCAQQARFSKFMIQLMKCLIAHQSLACLQLRTILGCRDLQYLIVALLLLRPLSGFGWHLLASDNDVIEYDSSTLARRKPVHQNRASVRVNQTFSRHHRLEFFAYCFIRLVVGNLKRVLPLRLELTTDTLLRLVF